MLNEINQLQKDKCNHEVLLNWGNKSKKNHGDRKVIDRGSGWGKNKHLMLRRGVSVLQDEKSPEDGWECWLYRK